jgi:serine/threonine protein kinase
MSSLIGQTLLGRYRVDAFVGRGGMAEVYKAWDNKRAAFVAIKILNADLAEDFVFLRRFTREAELLKRLEHPNIIRSLGFEHRPGLAFLVMEFVDGLTVRRYLNLLGRPLTLAETLGILNPVCSALHYAHTLGIYHCDIKPANIFIEHSGRIVLADFGIARLSESATVTLSTPGTPAYMSPEQCRGADMIDGRTDIYSLGITAYELLTLDRPFKGETDSTTGSRSERIRWEQTHLQPPSPRSINADIPASIEAVILKALAKDPQQRPQRVLDFLVEFQRAANVSAIKVLPAVVEDQPELIRSTPIEPKPIESTQVTQRPVRTFKTQRGLILTGISAVLLVAVILIMAARSPKLSSTPITPTTGSAPARVTPPPTFEATVAPPPTLAPTPTPFPMPTIIPSNLYVLYMLDASNSMMQDGKFDTARSGLSQHLRSLDPTINIGLLVFGHKINAVAPDSCSGNVEMLAGLQANSGSSISAVLPSLSAIGKSPLAEAINTTYEYFKFQRDRTNAVILIVDGADNCSGVPLSRIQKHQEVGQLLPIYIVGLNVKSDEEAQLHQIAAATSGLYRTAVRSDELVQVLDEFVAAIRRH